MGLDREAVAEELAAQFSNLPATEVLDVVCACADDFPGGDPLFIEHAARARLETRGRADALDVSLHDAELQAEVEQSAPLIIAANTSRGQLLQWQIDALLFDALR